MTLNSIKWMLVPVALVSAHPARAETFDLTVVAGHPPVFAWVKQLHETFIPAVDAELAKSGTHDIDWNEAYGGTLARVGQEVETIRDGVADMGTAFSLFSPDKLPLQNVSYAAPFGSDDPALVISIIETLQSEFPEMTDAWTAQNQIYLGGGIANDSYQLFTNFPVNDLSDLSGRKIGTPGSTAAWLSGSGAVPVASDLAGYYNSIGTGIFDGAITFATAAVPAKLTEVAPNITQIDFGATFGGGITFNADRWETLPPEVQEAIRIGMSAYEDALAADLNARTESAGQALKASGAAIRYISDDQRAAYADAMPNTARNWAEALDKQGLPGSAVLARYYALQREAGVLLPRDWDIE